MKTLRGRLAAFFAATLVIVLVAFAAIVWAIIEAEEAAEPPEVAALEPPEHTDRNLALALGTALLVAVPIAIAGAVAIARRGLGPLEDVIATTTQISTDSLDRRIAVDERAPAEVARLVTSVNTMLGRLEQSVNGMRRFTADASHELRTPLATLMGELEVTLRRPRDEAALRETVEGSLEELGRLSRLVEALLALARSDASALPIAPVDVELAAHVRRIAEPYDAVIEDLVLDLSEVHAHTDPLLVGRVVANLLDNACKHAPGRRVTVTTRHDGDRALVAVTDDGAGIDAASRERIFERFYRGPTARAREGFGLGLPLARELARALGGDLTLEGTRFVLALPVGRTPPK